METTAETFVNPKKLAFTNGLIWAAINIAIFLVTYYVKPEWMGSTIYQIIQFLLGLGLAIYFCLDLRSKVGGYWSFKEALGGTFIMFLSQALIVYFFTIIFGKFIEPEYVVKMEEIRVNATTTMMERMGQSQEQIDEVLAKSADQANMSVKQIFIGLAGVIIMYFIGALIFAAIFKKERPLFMNTEE
jgi:hypothetical protein